MPRDGETWTQITPDALSVAEAVAFVTDPAAGGIDVFLGTTRAERNAEGRSLVALDYEAYVEMAEQLLLEIAGIARQRYPLTKLAILHRIGRVELGEPSVIIAVSTPHRSEAFEACWWLIDALKQMVTIWKKEIWDDGTGSWVHPS
jgi:molybdopterin synthase catalytic subunit